MPGWNFAEVWEVVAEQISEDRGLGVVIDFLAETPGEAYCALCIAFTTNLGLAESRAVLHHLAAAPEFARNEAPCSTCGRVQIVVRANRGGAERLATLGDVLSGSVLHRGFRIDVRSFKTAAGWRPFALVRTDAGTLVPSAPAIVCGLMPSKLEADELAMAEARFWIEKRFLLSS